MENEGPAAPEIAIDDGVRKWHEACPCCLGETYPNVRRVLDAERRAARKASQEAAAESEPA